MENPRSDDGISIGDLLKKIVPKTKPSKKSLAGRRLAQTLLAENMADLKAQATVASVKKGVVVIEVHSSALFQELEGFRRQTLIDMFRAGGLQVREIRVKLVSA